MVIPVIKLNYSLIKKIININFMKNSSGRFFVPHSSHKCFEAWITVQCIYTVYIYVQLYSE